MKKTKAHAAMSVLFRIAIFQLIGMSLLLCFGCDGEEKTEKDLSISKITVYNIPATIPVNNGTGSSPAFKIYLNASDSQSPTEPPVAKGVAKISEGTLSDGKYSITLQLQNPNRAGNDDPNEDTGSWSGIAKYFSIMICPQSIVSDGVNAVWIKGSMNQLNKTMETCNWDTLMDFRTSPFVNQSQIQALYDDIICKDSEITKN